MTRKRNAVCLVTIKPHIVWLDFLRQFHNYDVYIVVDRPMDPECRDFVQITNEDCIRAGYIHSSFMPTSSLVFNEIIAWDRALYYFTNVRTEYDNVWFFEDDVFFYGENTILNVDKKYPNSDILCKQKNPQPVAGEWAWFWPAISIDLPMPYFHSPICAVRMSRQLLSCINEYVSRPNVRKLFFIEAMFPTIAHYHGLVYDMPTELSEIHWRRDWSVEDMNRGTFFHPMKDMDQQREFRELLMLQAEAEGEIGSV